MHHNIFYNCINSAGVVPPLTLLSQSYNAMLLAAAVEKCSIARLLEISSMWGQSPSVGEQVYHGC